MHLFEQPLFPKKKFTKPNLFTLHKECNGNTLNFILKAEVWNYSGSMLVTYILDQTSFDL